MLKTVAILDGELRERAYDVYYECFAPLQVAAVQQHLMSRADFDEIAADEGTDKVLIADDAGAVVGLTTITNDLSKVSLVSNDYYEAHYPTLYKERKILYVPLIAILPHCQGRFAELVTAFFQICVTRDAVLGMDVCDHNVDLGFVKAIRLLTERCAGPEPESGHKPIARRIDAQSYWLFDPSGRHL